MNELGRSPRADARSTYLPQPTILDSCEAPTLDSVADTGERPEKVLAMVWFARNLHNSQYRSPWRQHHLATFPRKCKSIEGCCCDHRCLHLRGFTQVVLYQSPPGIGFTDGRCRARLAPSACRAQVLHRKSQENGAATTGNFGITLNAQPTCMMCQYMYL